MDGDRSNVAEKQAQDIPPCPCIECVAKRTAAVKTAYGSIAGGRKRDSGGGALAGVGIDAQAWVQTTTEAPIDTLRPSMAEESMKRAAEHGGQASKALRAAIFFRDNPAFEEFIRLIRSGAIQL